MARRRLDLLPAMSKRKTPFVIGEWYHCYSRGIDKQVVFLEQGDYDRFLKAVYLTNQVEKVNLSDLTKINQSTLWKRERSSPIVTVGAYCLMPNHFHFLFKETIPNGISMFMQRLGTAYTMYFNKKYDRSGGLFTRPFRSKHVSDDRYFRWLVNYIHMNPKELLERCEEKEINLTREALPRERLRDYPYSSLPDYLDVLRPEQKILDRGAVECLLHREALPRF